jgi:hypothetical protein
VSSGYNQGGFSPPPQGGYPGQGYGQPGVPPRPPAGGAKPVPPVVMWIILGITALNLILTTYVVIQIVQQKAAAAELQEQFQDSLGNLPDLGGLGG